MKKALVALAAIAAGLALGRLAADATFRESRLLNKQNADLYKKTASEEEKLSNLKRTVNAERRNLSREAVKDARKETEP